MQVKLMSYLNTIGDAMLSHIPLIKLRLMLTLLFLLHPLALLGQDALPTIAINNPALGDGLGASPPRNLNLGLLQAEMEASFTATRKFQVISRNKSTLKTIRDEQNLAQSDFAAGDAAATGEISNANYFLLPVVQDFVFARVHRDMPNIDNKYFRTDSGRLSVSAQMIDTTTGQVVATYSMKDGFATKRKVVNSKGGSPDTTQYARMAKNVATELADLFVDAVFPMKVVSRNRRGNITINRGSDGGLKLGQVLDVFYVGDELIDPDTGKSLGSEEEYVGRVEVIRINPKFTVTKIVKEEDSTNAPIGVGDILRRPQ
jgi:hypothetical protein